MLLMRLSDSCTTGWTSWGLGDLWLTPDTLVRLGGTGRTGEALRRSAARSAVGGALGGALGGAAVALLSERRRARNQRPTTRDLTPAAWEALVNEAPYTLTIPLSGITAADLKPGTTTSRLDLTMSDGQRVTLMWARNDDALALVHRAVTDLEAHRAAFTDHVSLLPPAEAGAAPGTMAHDVHGDDARAQDVLHSGMAPAPHSIEELRAGCPDGRVVTTRVEAAGGPAFLRVTRFDAADDAGVTMHRSRHTLEGAPLEDGEAERVTWADLQAQALFPAEDTAISADLLETASGAWECQRYVVRRAGGAIESYWFARTCPGLPVQVQIRVGAQVTATITVVADEAGGEAGTPG